ncbi:MAG: type II/IV secretion system protein [Candidatus Sericytochromatia bacterium]
MTWNLEDKISAELLLLKFIEENTSCKNLSKEILSEYKKTNIHPIDLIFSKNIISEEELVQVLADKLNYKIIKENEFKFNNKISEKIPSEFLSYHLIFPLNNDDNFLNIAIFNPFEEKALEELKKLVNKEIIINLATKQNLLNKINEFYFSNKKALIQLKNPSEFLIYKNYNSEINTYEKRLVKFLESSNVLNINIIEFLIEKSKELNKSLLELLDENSLINILSELLGYPTIDLFKTEIDKNILKLVKFDFANENICFPISLNKKTLNIAIFNPFQFETIIELEKNTGYSVKTFLSTRQQIYLAIIKNYPNKDSLDINNYGLNNLILETENTIKENEIKLEEEIKDDNLLEISHDDAPVVKMVNFVISKAIKDKASDIHIEPNEKSVIIRNRVDGILTEVLRFQKYMQNAFTSRIKILSKLDISEKRIPQDGKIKLKFESNNIDIRVSTLPTNFGETIVMRILNSSSIKNISLDKLGFSKDNFNKVKNAIEEPQGIILVTGPTGSGKSSTLYSFIKEINSPSINIVTVEDPIEYTIEGINQVQVNTKAGLTFASSLRAILRQDPDVVLIGEMRDHETAEIGFNASMTGHLVFSTLHTNDAVSSITRLIDLEIPLYMMASSIICIIAQRLVRKNCNNCIETYSPDSELLKKLDLVNENIIFKKGNGCNLCNNTGYKGRLGVYEIIEFDHEIKKILRNNFKEDLFYEHLEKNNFNFIFNDGLNKVKEGLTTLEEIIRVLGLHSEKN